MSCVEDAVQNNYWRDALLPGRPHPGVNLWPGVTASGRRGRKGERKLESERERVMEGERGTEGGKGRGELLHSHRCLSPATHSLQPLKTWERKMKDTRIMPNGWDEAQRKGSEKCRQETYENE